MYRLTLLAVRCGTHLAHNTAPFLPYGLPTLSRGPLIS
jgi:hypothetical protein